jgi:hypothetical protein
MSGDWKDPGRPSPILPHLRDAFLAAREGHQLSLDTLRDAVCGYVAELRHRGADDEDVQAAVLEQMEAMTALEPDEAAPQWKTDLMIEILASCDDD